VALLGQGGVLAGAQQGAFQVLDAAELMADLLGLF
jgi:hypothetical protein